MKKEHFFARIRAPFDKFIRIEASSSIVLIICTAFAFIAANSSFAGGYDHFWHEQRAFSFSFAHFINDGLMAVFFFVVGLEIKRELLTGELSSFTKASLPVFGAIGGMLVPALIFFSLNNDTPTAGGWGIPMATDIAFAVGVVSLLGKRVHPALKVFLMALAIVDDIGAVLVIALFYTSTINWLILLIAFGLIGLLLGGNIKGVNSLWFYSGLGIVVWLLFLQTGVHATIAGVLVALTIPASSVSNQKTEAPLFRFENSLHSFVAFVIMPLFALANAGVSVSGSAFASITEPLPLGILLGLCIGKPLGITLFAWLGSKVKLASLPSNVGWGDLFLISILGGIGFTMSLFITNLAFTDQGVIDKAKLGVLLGSLVAGGIGYILLLRKPFKT
jgi:NhaA family Na+:H+ antiporter